MSKLGYCMAAVVMLGGAIAVPYMLQDPAPVVEADGNSGKPALSGRLDMQALGEKTDVPAQSPKTEEVKKPEAQTPAAPVIAETKPAENKVAEEKEARKPMPPLPSTSAMTMTEGTAQPEKTEVPVPAEQPVVAEVAKPAPVVENKPAPKREIKEEKPARTNVLVTRSTLPDSPKATVTEAVLSMDGDEVVLTLQANQKISGKKFVLSGPDRVVLDLAGSWKFKAPHVGSNRMVKALRTGARSDSLRLVFDMRVTPHKAVLKQISPQSLELRIR